MVDPLVEESRRWSTYNYVMNNPIKLIDPDGRTWKDTTAANKLLQTAVNKEIQDNNQIAADQDKIDNGGLSDADKKTMQGKIDELKYNAMSLGDAIQDILDLGADQQHTYSLADVSDGITNHVHKNEDNGVIEIQGANDAQHIHEISHTNVASKYGDLDDGKHWDSDNNLGDHWNQGGGARDEIRAYQHQFAFDPSSFGGKGFPSPRSINDIDTNYLTRINANGVPLYPNVVEAVQEAKKKEKEPH